MSGSFIWHELASTAPADAARFYAAVVGWAVEAVPALDYTVLTASGRRVAGIMTLPEHVRARGVGPHWTGYIAQEDVEAGVSAVQARGGVFRYGPEDIPGVGRFAVMGDAEGLPFVLFAPSGVAEPEAAPMALGHVGWNELACGDGAAACDFYAGLFGWDRSTGIDMGPMGTYQIFACGGQDRGGIMTAPPGAPRGWLFYFVVDGLDAAVERVGAAGGQVVFGPQEVPGGAWIVNATDPQGARFGLVSAVR